MSRAQILNVALDTRVLPRTHGGLATATMGLVDALGRLEGQEIYHLLVENDEQLEWVGSHKGMNQRVVDERCWSAKRVPRNRLSRPAGFVRRLLRPTASFLRSIHRRLHTESPAPWPQVEMSNGCLESLGFDVIHFTWQRFVLAALPTIYTPHDLQHLHFPQFFTAQELARREVVYPAGCHFAHTVIAGTQWIKDDIVRQYSIHPDKVQVIPWAPPTLVYPDPTPSELATIRTKYDLSPPFALYPAAAWPHKNHIRLLEAIAHLRDTRGITIRLVCTGSLASSWVDYWPRINERLHELNLGAQVKALGFVPESDMRAIYRLAQFLVLPSLFEADSCPIHEAWVEGLPVASSNVTALPDQVLDAGLLFDPMDVRSIAGAIEQLATSPDLRLRLIERGHRRVRDFDWSRTAAAYRAVYRRAARLPLNEEDRWLLEWDWMREPGRSRPMDSS